MNPVKNRILQKSIDPLGIVLGTTLIILWFVSLLLLLQWELDYSHPMTYLAILVQTHLYTGLFITSHDAMHGTVSKRRGINTFIGRITALLFAFNFYDRLIKKHHMHHRFVASHDDPDYHESGKFWRWYWNFLKNYITWKQLLLMSISFQLLQLVFPTGNLILFWILPSILSTCQLFYFGTYLAHKEGHETHNEHNARTLEKNHVWAFLSCYFFGYHFEHHDAPAVPWWRLWQMK